jgi:hypothetical protein
MPTLHVIERGDFPENLTCLNKEKNEWESGFWAIIPETAQRLVGGTICLHEAQDKRSRFGGEILSFRIATEEKHKGRVAFRFRATQEARDVRAGLDNWSQEKKFCW